MGRTMSSTHLGLSLLLLLGKVNADFIQTEEYFPEWRQMPPPAYMKDNQGNTFHTAPDKGTLNGPILSTEELLNFHHNAGPFADDVNSTTAHIDARATTYWYPGIAHGQSPYAPSGYKVYRNVKDYGAKGDGVTDDTVAINNAIADGNRCGQSCGSTSVLYASVFFPPGTYMISAPIIQYYFTQFIGDPTNLPTIKGMPSFQGIALIDTDVYIPGGNGAEWYINQNQFYRTIKNFNIDLTAMALHNYQGGQEYSPTGIHWQVAQATSLQNINFKMQLQGNVTAVGIMMENGSGGFASDLTFYGGYIGFMAGSQQYTARNLTFTGTLTAISMGFDWGFTFQQISMTNVYTGFDCQYTNGRSGQGVGSISIIDSTFDHVPYLVPYSAAWVPNVVLDNVVLTAVPQVVFESGKPGCDLCGPAYNSSTPQTVVSWGIGRRYQTASGTGTSQAANFSPVPSKPAALLDGTGRWFTQSKPNYANNPPTVVATANGIKNDGTGDQSTAINTLLSKNVGKVIFFPAGIYNVANTVLVPKGSILVGELWSQIRGSGVNFQNASAPRPIVRVGNAGDSGVVQLSDFLFTVAGPTAGAILVEWNIKQSTKGSAAMWDCHFRVGGAVGTNLSLADCPKSAKTVNPKCQAASLLFHVTASGSGYFENVWAWVADHDLDANSGGASDTSATQIDIYAARGVLIESKGPSWFYGTASEHSVMYQYQLNKAQNIYLGHVQTESPYFQPSPQAPAPFKANAGGFSDPNFAAYPAGTYRDAWALRVVNTSNVFIYSGGFYSFYNNYGQSCLATLDCQARVIDTSYSTGLWLYNIFTLGSSQALSPEGLPVVLNTPNQHGNTTEISAYLALAKSGGNLGNKTSSAPS